jgi:hypothetical protein
MLRYSSTEAEKRDLHDEELLYTTQGSKDTTSALFSIQLDFSGEEMKRITRLSVL